MKRSEMLNHIKEDLLEKLKHRWLERGETDKWAEYTANQLLDMIEGFGMLPPPTKTDTVTSYLVYCYYPEVTGNATDQLDITNSQLWEPEDEAK